MRILEDSVGLNISVAEEVVGISVEHAEWYDHVVVAWKCCERSMQDEILLPRTGSSRDEMT